MFLGKGVHFKDHIVTAALLQWHGEGGGARLAAPGSTCQGAAFRR